MKQKIRTITVPITDPTASGAIPLLKVPVGNGAMSVVGARYYTDTALAQNVSNGRQFQLQNAGSAGAGSTAIHTAVGGANVAWAAGPANGKEATLSTTAASRRLAEGEILNLVYTKTGTDSWKNCVCQIDVIDGQR